jgi:hypothetical protein
MFTEGTRQFGIWKVGHPSKSRHSGRPTQAILLAYGFCAFLTWFIFIFTLKIRSDFFLVESLSLPLHTVTSGYRAKSVTYPASLTLGVRPSGIEGKQRIIFDSGHSFLFPDERTQLETAIRNRVSDIELTALLKKKLSAGLGTVDVWVDRRVSLKEVQPLAKTLVRSGFDTLRYAVDSSAQKPAEAH